MANSGECNFALLLALAERHVKGLMKQGTMQGKSRHQSALPDIPKDHPLLMPRVRAAKKTGNRVAGGGLDVEIYDTSSKSRAVVKQQ